jgi:shikimate dehydrogenase
MICSERAQRPAVPGLVTARTRVLFMIGTPVAQTRSPDLFNRHFAETGVDRIMVALEVRPDQVAAFLAVVRGAANCYGLVATVPLKQTILPCIDMPTDRARALGAVNVVRREPDGRLAGDMVDGPGFWNAAAVHGFDPRGRLLVLAGGGAAATAIAHEFAQRGGRRLAVATPGADEFARLARTLGGAIEVEHGRPSDLAGYDIAVNATPLGMDHAPGTAFPRTLLESLPRHAVVADAVTDPAETQLLADARTIGLQTVTGEEMTRGQFRLLAGFLGV